MDPLRSYLGRLLLEEITPVVMVLTTPLAEATCCKSGLSSVDMLSPFSLFKKIDGDAPSNAWLQIIPCIACWWLVL
jgi:trafficking protein particle complex subunit 8